MWNQITTPAFLVDTGKVRKNIGKMAEKTKTAGVIFRPHFKTHQSGVIGRIFREYGVDKITVSSLSMAEFFAAEGWKDITVAFPVNIREIDTINRLAGKITLGLLLDSGEAADFLDANLKAPVKIWIKIDNGYRRAGIPVDDASAVLDLALRINKSQKLSLAGLLTHAGQTYNTTSAEAIQRIFAELAEKFLDLTEHLERNGLSGLTLSWGDTPTCSRLSSFSPFDEIRPGNFVYYDIQQLQIGSCREEEIAVAAACPVVGIYPNRGEAVIYGGAVHLSKQGLPLPEGKTIFGRLFRPAEKGWKGLIKDSAVISISQEHGIVSLPAEELASLKLGDLLLIAPVHSCLTADLLKVNTLLF